MAPVHEVRAARPQRAQATADQRPPRRRPPPDLGARRHGHHPGGGQRPPGARRPGRQRAEAGLVGRRELHLGPPVGPVALPGPRRQRHPAHGQREHAPRRAQQRGQAPGGGPRAPGLREPDRGEGGGGAHEGLQRPERRRGPGDAAQVHQTPWRLPGAPGPRGHPGQAQQRPRPPEAEGAHAGRHCRARQLGKPAGHHQHRRQAQHHRRRQRRRVPVRARQQPGQAQRRERQRRHRHRPHRHPRVSGGPGRGHQRAQVPVLAGHVPQQRAAAAHLLEDADEEALIAKVDAHPGARRHQHQGPRTGGEPGSPRPAGRPSGGMHQHPARPQGHPRGQQRPGPVSHERSQGGEPQQPRRERPRQQAAHRAARQGRGRELVGAAAAARPPRQPQPGQRRQQRRRHAAVHRGVYAQHHQRDRHQGATPRGRGREEGRERHPRAQPKPHGALGRLSFEGQPGDQQGQQRRRGAHPGEVTLQHHQRAPPPRPPLTHRRACALSPGPAPTRRSAAPPPRPPSGCAGGSSTPTPARR